jgi:hypothetical protein
VTYSYALEIEIMVVIGERDARNVPSEAVRTTIDRDEPSVRQAFAFMARSPSAVQHGWFHTPHDKNVDRLECRAPAAVDCEPAASESRGLVRSLLTSSRAGSAGCGACSRLAAGRAAYLAWLDCWPRRLYGHAAATCCVSRCGSDTGDPDAEHRKRDGRGNASWACAGGDPAEEAL